MAVTAAVSALWGADFFCITTPSECSAMEARASNGVAVCGRAAAVLWEERDSGDKCGRGR